jgi:hypothetical protein
MANPQGQLIEICPATPKNSIRDMQERAAAEGLPRSRVRHDSMTPILPLPSSKEPIPHIPIQRTAATTPVGYASERLDDEDTIEAPIQDLMIVAVMSRHT